MKGRDHLVEQVQNIVQINCKQLATNLQLYSEIYLTKTD